MPWVAFDRRLKLEVHSARITSNGGLLAHDLAKLLHSLALPNEVAQWSLSTLREKLVKTGARIVRHGRFLVFPRADVSVLRAQFAAVLSRIDRLRAAARGGGLMGASDEAGGARGEQCPEIGEHRPIGPKQPVDRGLVALPTRHPPSDECSGCRNRNLV